MAGPLQGVRVIDMTSMISGPLATMILGDQGADVIKIENPRNGGDHTRLSDNAVEGISASFLNNNRNKRSVALDLKHPAGRDVLLRLARDADVFVQNFRPGVVERMGVGEDDIRAVAPDIVYVSICGFGHEGPYAHKPVYDPLVQALSGLTTIQGGGDDQRPRLVRTIVPDKLTGVTGAQAIAAALFARERTGKGQHVRLSMLDSVVSFLWSSDMGSQTFVRERIPQQEAMSFIDLVYETADGYITIAVQSDREWMSLCRALDRPDWLEDERFKTPTLRQKNIDVRLELIQGVIAADSTDHWLARLEAEDVPCAPVLTRTETLDHPQHLANGNVVEGEHPQAGPIRQARPAAQFSVTQAGFTRDAPLLGADTEACLSEAGFDADEIEKLAAAGVFGER